ncbi:MAG TPA: hypothetical protein DCL86_15000 [Bacteroidales bacterium]|nr:hypothetical protein [Bacteroidales bacterium]
MKKKTTLFLLLSMFTVSTFAQLLERSTFNVPSSYKKHYSHNIEGGTVDGIQKEFVVGNWTDFLTTNNTLSGQSVTGNIIGPGVNEQVIPVNSRVALTDFAVFPSKENQYAIGTGIYYPNAPTELSGYPFLGIYDRKTMGLLQLYYYNLSYPMDKVDKNSVGLRIKYSEKNNSVYISGILCENILPQMNMNELVGKSQGFILKIDFSNPSAGQALVFGTDDLPIIPLLCAVTDMEIDITEQEIIFTGINTKQSTPGYYSPFAGKIDMNLNLQWSKTFSFGSDRFSGVDVEYSNNNNFLMLMNSDNYDFAVMEISGNGLVLQQPIKYQFSYGGDKWPARSHIMHFNKTNIYITGNLFEAERTQYLYSYEITDATNLLSGNLNYKIYSSYPIPTGKQQEVTNYWAPENSILFDGYLSIVGIYNNLDQTSDKFGYCLIHTAGYSEEECLMQGSVAKLSDISSSTNCIAHLDSCRNVLVNFSPVPGPATFNQLCPSHGKSMEVGSNDVDLGWRINSIDETGIMVTINTKEETSYLVNIYTTSGQRIHSEKIKANEQKAVRVNFPVKNQLYLISVSDGTKTETIKVSGVR